jgi:phosphoglucan,water dikinase
VNGKIRIGNQTAFSAPTTTRPFEYAVANGFNAFEWFPDKKASGAGWDVEDINADTRSYIKNTAITFGIRMSVHAPWQANPLLPGAVGLILRNLEFAVDIGASLLNVHFFKDSDIEAFARAIVPVIKAAQGAGMRLSIENTPYTGPGDFNVLFEMLLGRADVPRGHIGMCFDIGHANLHAITLNDYLRYMDMLDPEVPVIHVHMHENYGVSDSHLPLFTGPSAKDPSGIEGFIRRLKDLGYSGSIILEQWPEPPSLLNQARERLYHIIHSTHVKRGFRDLHKEGAGVEREEEQTGFLYNLIKGDATARSWREKLGLVLKLMKGEHFEPTLENLVYLSIYMRFLGTGKIKCGDDGGHYRPGHHANTALLIEERLREIATPENAFIIRKIYPWLPSYDSSFTRHEPLTRIRDIAHRSDIPKELKKEIKHTLQNKLHRCAGPEDLLTSRALLKRIKAPGAGYPPLFVEEFRRFHEELSEFFNAGSLNDVLTSMLDKQTLPEAPLIRKFLTAKGRGPEDPVRALETLEMLTELRADFSRSMQSSTGAEAQKYRLADIGLEEFAFALLSGLVNHLEGMDSGAVHLDVGPGTLSLSLMNLCLSGLYQDECSAIINELNALKGRPGTGGNEEVLRLKASLERCLRLSNKFSEMVLSLYPEKVEKMGRALGVDEENIRLFTEGDIRGNLNFQFSRLAAALLKHTRARASLPPWDPVVTGRSEGHAIAVKELGEIVGSAGAADGGRVVLLENAEGDEEIPAGVTGIILAHPLPHLSHLGVRARQKDVVFAVCEDRDTFRGLGALHGRPVVLEVSASWVSLGETPPDSITRAGLPAVTVFVQETDLSFRAGLIGLEEASFTNSGGKAYAMRRLKELSSSAGGEAAFKTPSSAVIPFGVMAEALAFAPELWNEYKLLSGMLKGLLPGNIGGALQSLRALIGQLNIPGDVIEVIRTWFPPDMRFIVRSSTNCEDLEDFSGAGQYESVPNVPRDGLPDAVRKVWSSLWTERAVLARQEAGIPHDSAHMAVLIQNMLTPEFSFFMHTVNPVNHNRDELYIELAVGLGETLAAGIARGTPYRLVCGKSTGDVRTTSFASIDGSLWPDMEGGLLWKTVDYSSVSLSADPDARKTLGRRLASVGRLVEEAFGRPQDIEGAVVGDDIYLVQTRPAQGIK